MPVPFGISIGDFIAFIDTSVKIVNALKDSTGSSQEYQEVARELESLKLALVEVQNVGTDDPQTKAALESVASNCHRTIQDFLKKTQKYDDSLSSAANPRKRLKNGFRKIQWALYSKEDVKEFQMQLYSHTASLNLLVSRVNYATAAKAQKEQSDAIIRIESKMDQERRQTIAMQAMIMTAITRCWKEFQAMAAFILFSNFRIFDLVAGCAKVPTQIMFDKPVIFQDAHGRILPVQMAWVDTWDHFETMLKWKFSDVPGLSMVEHGQYVLADAFAKKDIDRTKSIQAEFRPGRNIDMSMVFRLKSILDKCPKCDADVLESSDFGNHCEQCGLWYSRIKQSLNDHGNDVDPSPGFEYLSVAEPETTAPTSWRCQKNNSQTDAISDFSRVRIFELEDDSLSSESGWTEISDDTTISNPEPGHGFDEPLSNMTVASELPITSDGNNDDAYNELEPSQSTERTVNTRSTHTEDEANSSHESLRNTEGPPHPEQLRPQSDSQSIPARRASNLPRRFDMIAEMEAKKRENDEFERMIAEMEAQEREREEREMQLAEKRAREREEAKKPEAEEAQIIEPPKNAPKKETTPPKSILREPTSRYPEDPNPIREGVAPLKDASKKGIPHGARWTKIDRRLVSPGALEEAKERFEERVDCVIVLRVLSREEIQQLADRTKEIRDGRSASDSEDIDPYQDTENESRKG